MVNPPRAKKIEHRATLHGITRSDPYDWLRDDNWQRVMREPELLDPAIREHLEAENTYTEQMLAPTAALRQALFEELKGRIKEDESSVPAKDGPFDYYVRYELGSQHPRYCRRPTRRVQRLGGAESSVDEMVLFDADAASKLHPYFSVGSVVHSRSHRLLAHAVDTKGSEYYDIAFRELDAGSAPGSSPTSGAAPSHTALPDLIQNTSGALVFADDSIVFYTAVDDNHRPSKVYRHRLGTPQSEDVLVYEEPDPGFFVGVDTTEDYAHIVITSHDHVTSEQRLIEAQTPLMTPRLIAARMPGIEYSVSSLGEHLLLLTNAGALDFKLALAPLDNPAPSEWRDLVPHQPGRLIVAVTTFARHIVRLEREGGLPRIVVRSRDDGQEHVIEFNEQAYSLGLTPGYEYDTTVLRFTYSSLTTPQQTFDYDMVTHDRVLVDQREIPSGHDPKRYRTARVFAPSHDGAEVPVSLLWHESTSPASAPLYLYGYGSYGHTVAAGFSSNTLSLVNRGFVYAIAHVRGGKDKGYAWYENGKLMRKKNTFLDFVFAAEHLYKTGYGQPGNVTIHGGSAGGMLVGAAVNLRPDLFKAVVGEVPFVDVLNTMCDAELPLTPPEWPEWGNPIESAEAYRYIASYSPYDNLEAKTYPHILATAGLTDPRVTYWEPAKWVARLRDVSQGERLLLLRTYMEAGHAGAAGRFEKLHQVALVQAFVLLAHGALGNVVLPAR
jgi:oligopeptidase B